MLGLDPPSRCFGQQAQSSIATEHNDGGVQEGATLRLTNTLRSGETVGDLDVLDGVRLTYEKVTEV